MDNKRNNRISNLQFILCTLVVFIHANTLFINLPGEDLQYVFGPNAVSFIQLILSEGICRIAVPMFFVISGYLFYSSFDGSLHSYFGKMMRRLRSLVIPYLLWSGIVFFLFYFAQRIPGLSNYFTTRNDADLSLKSLLQSIILDSYNSPLWFCRYLICFSVLAIVLYYPYRYAAIPVLLLLFYGWFLGFWGLPIRIPIRMDALFFHSLGAVIALHPSPIRKINLLFRNMRLPILVLYLLILVSRTLLLCHQSPDYLLLGRSDSALELIGKIGIMTGMLSLWYGSAFLDSAKAWDISHYAFLIFAAHHPLVNALKKGLMKLLGVSLASSLATYFASAAMTVLVIYGVGKLMHRFMPRALRLMTGGR